MKIDKKARVDAVPRQRPAKLLPVGRIREPGFIPGEDRGDEGDRNQPDGRHREGEDEKPIYKPTLVCRTYAFDDGIRPLAPGICFWESPDISVVAPDGSDIPIAGEVNEVIVHVWNTGLAPSYGAHVQLYWCNPSVGVNLAAATQIGATQILTIQAQEHKIVKFDWTPTLVNNGHECLVAQVFDPVSDNLVAPFDPVNDSHVGQHNINQVRAQPGSWIPVQFFASNLSQFMARSTIEVQALWGEALQGVGKSIGLDFVAGGSGARAAIAGAEAREVHPTLDLGKHPVAAIFRHSLEPVPQRFVRSLLETALREVPAASAETNTETTGVARRRSQLSEEYAESKMGECRATTHEMEIRPGHELSVSLIISIPTNALPGTTYAYRVLEQSGGKLTGGITYVFHVDRRS